IVKPVNAYKLNLATFQENTKFVHKSIVVSRVGSIHTVPIRIQLSSADAVLTAVPVTDEYSNVFESKLRELLTELKSSITTIKNNEESLKTDTTSQFAALTSLITTNKNNIENLKAHTPNQLTELKSAIKTVKQTLSRLERKMHECDISTEDYLNYRRIVELHREKQKEGEKRNVYILGLFLIELNKHYKLAVIHEE
ncbi:unnamed protein product, partial [Didymodactylos carnosus]